MGPVRRVVVLALCAGLVAACDPGPASAQIGLLGTDDGPVVLFESCSGATVESVAFGEGTDMWSAESIVATPNDDVDAFSLSFADPSDFTFSKGASELAVLETPFFVRVQLEGGEVPSRFTEEPPVGVVLYPKSGGPSAGYEHLTPEEFRERALSSC